MAEGSVVQEAPQTEQVPKQVPAEAKKNLTKREWLIKKLKKASQVVGLAAFTIAHMYQPGSYDAQLKDVGKAMQMTQRKREDDASRQAIELKSKAVVDTNPPVIVQQSQEKMRTIAQERKQMHDVVSDARLQQIRDQLKEAA